MLKVNNLVKNYEDFALNCSLEVQPGCITGLIGRNGAGKSTTFKAVLGLIRMDGGSVEILGKDASRLTARDRKKLGVVLSDSGFSTYLSVKDISCILKSMYKEFDGKWFQDQCRRFKLPPDKKLKEYSTGMKAKLKVAAALSHNASLLILDEPTVGLDVMVRDEILDLLRSYMEEDETRSILISSHISSDLESLCDDFYMIHEGRILLHEETDVLLDRYGVLKLDPQQYANIDKRYIIKYKKETYGYRCLTDQRPYYLENYPGIALEKGNIDDLIVMMIGGKEL